MIPMVRRVQGPQDIARIQGAMEGQDELVLLPTHLIEKDGKVLGHWSVGAVPFVACWHHDDMKVRESLAMHQVFEAIMQDRGTPQYVIGLSKNSPYNHYMPKLGYRDLGRTNLYLGGINL